MALDMVVVEAGMTGFFQKFPGVGSELVSLAVKIFTIRELRSKNMMRLWIG
jgi:hypothetical protein